MAEDEPQEMVNCQPDVVKRICADWDKACHNRSGPDLARLHGNTRSTSKRSVTLCELVLIVHMIQKHALEMGTSLNGWFPSGCPLHTTKALLGLGFLGRELTH